MCNVNIFIAETHLTVIIAIKLLETTDVGGNNISTYIIKARKRHYGVIPSAKMQAANEEVDLIRNSGSNKCTKHCCCCGFCFFLKNNSDYQLPENEEP